MSQTIPISQTMILDAEQANDETRDPRALLAGAQKVNHLLTLAVLGTMHECSTASVFDAEENLPLFQELAWVVGAYLHALSEALAAREAPSPETPESGALRVVTRDEARS